MESEEQETYINWSTHPQQEQNETKIPIYGVDWLQKDIWYDPANLDNKLS